MLLGFDQNHATSAGKYFSLGKCWSISGINHQQIWDLVWSNVIQKNSTFYMLKYSYLSYYCIIVTTLLTIIFWQTFISLCHILLVNIFLIPESVNQYLSRRNVLSVSLLTDKSLLTISSFYLFNRETGNVKLNLVNDRYRMNVDNFPRIICDLQMQ